MPLAICRRAWLGMIGGVVGAAIVGCTSVPLDDPPADPSSSLSVTPLTSEAELSWTELGPAEDVVRLFLPASGPLYASTRGGLMWLDESSDRWTLVVPMPAGDEGQRVNATYAVSLQGGQTIYGIWKNVLYRTYDGGEHWQQLAAVRYSTSTLEISAADPRVIYLANMTGSTSRLSRSDDGGATWHLLKAVDGTLCHAWVPILSAHPTNPDRVHLTSGCYAGRNTDDELQASMDRGWTWARGFRPQREFPRVLAGGHGVDASRWYLGTSLHMSFNGGGSVFASRDDGRTWTRVLHWASVPFSQTGVLSTRVADLAFDPNVPDRVYAALNRSPANSATLLNRSGLLASNDGGQTWAELGSQELPAISRLLLSGDGRTLYAATRQGVWRLTLP